MVTCPLEKRAGALGLPLKHFLLAAAGLLAFSAALFLGRGRLMGFEVDARYALGTVHLLTIGFVSATILGVMCQMIPGHGGVPLRFPMAPRAAFWLLCAGLAGFVGMLWTGRDAYWLAAAAMATALALDIASLAATLAAGSRDVTARHFVAALSALVLVFLLGAAMAFDRQRGMIFRDGDGALIAHVHLALVGFVSLTILGGSYRLFYPMVMSRADSRWASQAAPVLLSAGVLGLAVDSLWFGRSLARFWAVVMTGGYLIYASQLRGLFHAKAERDLPSSYALLGMAGGALWCALGASLAFGALADRWESRAAYVLSALLGWAAPWILGQTYKIMPFLAWRAVTRGGTIEGPAFETMIARKLAWVPFFGLAGGVPLVVAGLLRERQWALSCGAACVLLGALAHAAQTGRVLSFVFRAGREARAGDGKKIIFSPWAKS